jgi:type II secretory pathway component GspD/PulD (secretin)
MKTMKNPILLVTLWVALASGAIGQPADTTKETKQPLKSTGAEQGPPSADKPVAETGAKPADNQGAAPPTQEAPAPSKDNAAPVPAPAAGNGGGQAGLRLNFRGVPLEMVLNYLSDAAGFIINIKPGTDVKGKVEVWSNQPLSKDEAVDLLDTVLNQNGYAAVRKGRTLTIMSRDEAKKDKIPVISTIPTNGPAGMANSDAMVTQIIPIRYANATQMTKDLQPLLPSYASLTANESANALVLTDTQSDVRRMVEIVRALDTSISSISAVRVFPLNYADAKDLASAVKDLFQSPNQQNNNNPAARFFSRFGGGRGGGFPGGGAFPGGVGDQSEGTGNSEARTAASRVVAVADERSNSLVVSAPDEFIPTIEQLVKELDVSVADITELRVFHLNNADPVELVDMFSQLFPDESKTNDANQNQNGFRFRGGLGGLGGFGGGFNNAANRGNQSTESDRTKKKGRVLAVADQRTSSIIVSAASELMPQIEAMVEQLDSSPARKQKVFFFPLENADPQQVQQILQDMFQRNTTQANRNNANQNSALSTRAQSNNQTTTGAGTGNSAFGNIGTPTGGQGQTFR